VPPRIRRLIAVALLVTLSGCTATAPWRPGALPRDVSAGAPPMHVVNPGTILTDVETPELRGSEPPAEGGPVVGPISWYGRALAGRPTASGEPFDPTDLTMAHPALPFGTRVRVTNPANGRSVVVRVNDRGPFVGERVADVSHAAARRLGMLKRGVIVATLELLGLEPHGDAAARGAAN
jgi:rare lipoprotein A